MRKKELDNFFARTLSSDLLADALTIFRNNPGLVDTLEGIARRLGTSGKSLSVELAAMKKVNLVREERIGSHRIVSFSSDADKDLSSFVGEKMAKKPARRGKSN